MLPDYSDIRALTDKDPLWFTPEGVPRYAPFEPDLLGVYDDFALLVEVECQSCRRRMLVGEGWTRFNLTPAMYGQNIIHNKIEDLAEGWSMGDPPRHGCVGDTMGCYERRIVEAWEKTAKTGPSPDGRGRVLLEMPHWDRRPDLEGPIDG